MIDPAYAATIIVTFIAVFGIGLPILNLKFPKYISYRWALAVVVAALLIGATVDFSGLSDDARKVILTGGLVIVGGYIALRTVEKVLANGWLRGSSLKVEKGDIKAELKSERPKEDKP